VVLHFNGIAKNTVVRQLLDGISEACVILNRERQIVLANAALTSLLNVKDPLVLCGLRPGEALNCVHAFERHEGCGTTEFCQTCGAVNAILTSQTGTDEVQECRILQRDGNALDLRVRAKSISINGEGYTLFSAIDISNEKRRKSLERIFFHDILNTAGAIHGFSELLAEKPWKEPERRAEKIHALTKRLVEEINAQRQLLEAESNELTVNREYIETIEFLKAVIDQHEDQTEDKQCAVRLDPASESITFRSDPVLLRRVIGNLLKNAIEASKDGEAVTIGCRPATGGTEFWIHNQAVMPKEVQLQVFQRSFSTKGTGRGVGTYGTKLITERCLKGKISFNSSPGEGTTFSIVCPIDLP
jgi:signal transduction histidine kinase